MHDEKIITLLSRLNNVKVLPSKAFRRDVSVYELICYVNNITGCYLSHNLLPIPILIERARYYMDLNQEDELSPYYELVTDYFKLLDNLIHNGNHSE
jgi:hypothetical protein